VQNLSEDSKISKVAPTKDIIGTTASDLEEVSKYKKLFIPQIFYGKLC
jgi:hypothetical protein